MRITTSMFIFRQRNVEDAAQHGGPDGPSHEAAERLAHLVAKLGSNCVLSSNRVLAGRPVFLLPKVNGYLDDLTLPILVERWLPFMINNSYLIMINDFSLVILLALIYD